MHFGNENRIILGGKIPAGMGEKVEGFAFLDLPVTESEEYYIKEFEGLFKEFRKKMLRRVWFQVLVQMGDSWEWLNHAEVNVKDREECIRLSRFFVRSISFYLKENK